MLHTLNEQSCDNFTGQIMYVPGYLRKPHNLSSRVDAWSSSAL